MEKLKRKQRFVSWKKWKSSELIVHCRTIFNEAIDKLLEGENSKKKVRSIIRQCVESLNRLDNENQFIDTIEREDLCLEIDELLFACGYPEEQGIEDRWREW